MTYKVKREPLVFVELPHTLSLVMGENIACTASMGANENSNTEYLRCQEPPEFDIKRAVSNDV